MSQEDNGKWRLWIARGCLLRLPHIRSERNLELRQKLTLLSELIFEVRKGQHAVQSLEATYKGIAGDAILARERNHIAYTRETPLYMWTVLSLLLSDRILHSVRSVYLDRRLRIFCL